MARAREMQGVPAHIEFLKPNDARRHPSHCLHHMGTGVNRICTNTDSPFYNKHCNSSKNCLLYVDERTQ